MVKAFCRPYAYTFNEQSKMATALTPQSESHVTDGEPETAVSASLQKIKSIKNQHTHLFIFICYFIKSQTCDSFVNHFDGHFAYLKTFDLSFNTTDHQILLSRLNSVFGIQSSGFSHISQTDISSLQSIIRLRHHHSSCSVCLSVLYTTPLSDIIANHSVNHQFFADDTQFQKSAPLGEVTNLTKELNACTDDRKTWMTITQHLSWKNCTGFLFQNVLSIKSLVCVSVL